MGRNSGRMALAMTMTVMVAVATLQSTAATEGRWKELAGEKHWEGILDPLDLDLRKAIINYGDMVEVCYDSYTVEPTFPNSATTRYSLDSMFKSTGVEARWPGPFPYTATKYLYATSTESVPGAFAPGAKQTNWMGFVAVASDEGVKTLGRRDVVITWRGTLQSMEWAIDSDYITSPATQLVNDSQSNFMAHHGFLSIYTSANPLSTVCAKSARDQVLEEVRRLYDQYKAEPMSISVVGHSLGSALCTLSTWDIARSGVAGNSPVTGYAFASPRVGDSNFQKVFDATSSARLLRITNKNDVVPQSPPPYAGYADIGQILNIDTTQSPYLVQPGNIGTWHDLECYLHGVAGTHGSQGTFKLEVNRDLKFLGKYGAMVQPYAMVAPFQSMGTLGFGGKP